MSEMTDDQVNRVLAPVAGYTITTDGHKASDPGMIFEDCGGLWIGGGMVQWSPPTNRDDLAEVLEKLTPEQWTNVLNRLAPSGWFAAETKWLLTSDPAIIARAVAEVVIKEQP